MRLSFHHVAHVVSSLAEAREVYERLGFVSEGSVVRDEAQGVNVQFFAAGGVRIELLEPLDGSSPVAAAAARGGGLAHLAYEVDDLDAAGRWLRDRGFLPVGATTAAPAIGGRRVAFFASALRQVIELVESNRPEDAR